MQGIVYVSEARMYFDNMTLEALAADCAARNFDRGITGYLYFENDRFVQYLEGADEDVSAVMDAIARDPRHSILHLIVEPELETRRFPAWHMRYLHRKELVEVRLENVLTDSLLYLDNMRSAAASAEEWEGVVWGMINRLSQMRQTLPHE